jgi:hypothetical protein
VWARGNRFSIMFEERPVREDDVLHVLNERQAAVVTR